MRKNKLLLLLALLLTAATGAWATDVYLVGNGTGNWLNGAVWYLDDAGNKMTEQNGVYSITFTNVAANPELKFKFVINSSWDETYGCISTDANELNKTLSIVASGNDIMFGLTEAADVTISFNLSELTYMISTKGMKVGDDAATGYTVSMKDGVKDADKWTVKVGEGEAQALPIGGLTGLSEKDAVTLQYNGRLKVKGVKATSDEKPAAPASTTLNNTITAWTAGSYAVPTGGLTYSDAITVSGDVTLVLTDGQTLTLNKGISLAEGATLTIQGNGTMNINGTDGNTSSTVAGSTGTLVLTSGTLTATGGNGGSVDVVESGAHGGNGGVAINGSVIVSGGSLTARGGNGGSVDYQCTNCSGGNGGDAISGSVTVSGGTLTATGGNGGSVGDYGSDCSGGNGGDAISGTLTKNGGSTSVNDGSNGSIGNMCDNCTAGTGGTSDAAPAKEPATVTTPPTGAAVVGVGKTTALVSGGVADGGTLWYAVTTTNTKPTSTAGFSDAVPTAKDITASGKVYVWYYVKGDDTHTDSEIAATAIEVPVADIVWDATNVSDLSVSGNSEPYEKEGVTLSCNANQISAAWHNYGDPTKDGISFNTRETGGFTFTAPTGKAFAKIEMKANGPGGWSNANLGTGWAFNNTTVTWTGSASTVDLLTGANKFNKGTYISYIAFYLSE